MLRITVQEGHAAPVLKLEGKLAGPWVAELERSWAANAAGAAGGRIRVDLSDVTFIDAEGTKLLFRMYEQGAELQAGGCMTRCIVEEAKRGSRAS